MNRTVRFSVVPVGDIFKHDNQVYTRSTYNRGKRYVSGKPVYRTFSKHQAVLWLNAYKTVEDK